MGNGWCAGLSELHTERWRESTTDSPAPATADDGDRVRRKTLWIAVFAAAAANIIDSTIHNLEGGGAGGFIDSTIHNTLWVGEVGNFSCRGLTPRILNP